MVHYAADKACPRCRRFDSRANRNAHLRARRQEVANQRLLRELGEDVAERLSARAVPR